MIDCCQISECVTPQKDLQKEVSTLEIGQELQERKFACILL